MRCWLCEYSDDPIAKSMAKFIADQAITMGPELMAERVHEALAERCPMADGIGLDEVLEHILTHTLCPSLRVACILRSMLRLADKLEAGLMSVDAETGQAVIDSKNVTAYLRVVSEILQTYRASGDGNRRLFATDTK